MEPMVTMGAGAAEVVAVARALVAVGEEPTRSVRKSRLDLSSDTKSETRVWVLP